MATTKSNSSTTRNRRGSRFGAIGDSVREQPLATAAVATVAAAAGAFFFARRSGVTGDTVAKWGQDAREELGNLTRRGKADSDNAQQGATADTGPTGKTSSPSSSAASKLASTGAASGGESGGKPATGKSTSPSAPDSGSQTSGNTGLDATAEDQTQTGSVAYGA